ncbi:MAG: alpha-L-fucosidase [Armatimonadetes bacterium]|nr:alpha-L-fucosidase [Armatimonadota bacterium]MDE2206199.1 alpha-L-fucosidase [Armatimonadota bacterium]
MLLLSTLSILLTMIPPKTIARPTRPQLAWQRMEMGMFIHFAPNTWRNLEGDDLQEPLADINPAGLDTDQWCRAARGFGAKYVVFVAKHIGGFCMWQTHTTDYGIRETPWRNGHGDVMADLAASCAKYHLKLGFYLSPRDDHFGAGIGGICKDPARQAAYTRIYREQLKELLTRYGPICEVWFDGNLKLPVDDILRQYAPNAVFFQGPLASIRWIGNEDGLAPYPTWNTVAPDKAATGAATGADGDPDGATWLPAEVDVSIRRPYWFWSTTNAQNRLSTGQLVDIYQRSVGHGCNLLLNVPPNTDGRIDAGDFAALQAFGAALRTLYGKPVATARGRGMLLTVHLARPVRIGRLVLKERIANGARVRAFTIEGQTPAGWRQVAEGTAIGSKLILNCPPVAVTSVRLIITRAEGVPEIARMAVYAEDEAAGNSSP